MTIERTTEIGITTAITAATAAGAMVEADMTGWLVPLISAGLASIVGYFTARATTEREIGVITEREGNHFNEIMRRLEHIDRKLDDR